MIPKDIKLYSWIDVEELLLRLAESGDWPQGLYRAHAYWDSLTLTVRPDCNDDINNWLADVFSPRFADNRIILEAANGHQRFCSLSFEEGDEPPPPGTFVPHFGRPRKLTSTPNPMAEPDPFEENAPQMFAFHSFKGGVGRTLHAIGFARALEKKGVRVLLVDGDFEAPGLSWLLEKRLPDIPICYADLLALAQGDASPDFAETLSLMVQKLKTSRLGGITVLPAFRNRSRWNTLEIRPEHLNTSSHPFLLANLLSRLGKMSGVDAVVIDTRAGLSELSAGLILDPRIQRVFVSSTSGQSVAGTAELLGIVHRYAPSSNQDHPLPAAIISMVPEELIEAPHATGEELIDPALSTFSEDCPVILSIFEERLLSLPLDWDDIIERIDQSSLIKGLSPLSDSVQPVSSKSVMAEPDTLREKLIEVAVQFEYAEVGTTPLDFLKTTSLQRLASDHRAKLPNLAVIGAKGSGKTYTYLQLARLATWKGFLNASNEPGDQDAHIVPLLHPNNISNDNRTLLDDVPVFGSPISEITLKDNIRANLKKAMDESQWRTFWLTCLAERCGLVGQDAGLQLPGALAEKGQNLIFIIDGLEDLFQDIVNQSSQRVALRALLQDLPQWIAQHPSQTIGLVIFVRRDLAASAIEQNFGQFERLHQPYRLSWNKTEALRLVAWICHRAKVLDAADDLLVWDLETLKNHLVPLWGVKLGRANSREAASANWVIDALSDFNQQIQARDLVRFLRVSAENSIRNNEWTDRILVPKAIRNSIDICSKDKVSEVETENAELKRIFEKMRQRPIETRTNPFRAKDLDLDEHDMKTLTRHGLIFQDKNDLYLPELYREGLGIANTKRGKNKVSHLQKQARRRAALK